MKGTNRTIQHFTPRWKNSYEPGLLVITDKKTGKKFNCLIDDKDKSKLLLFNWIPTWSPKVKSYYVTTTMQSPNGNTTECIHRYLLGICDPKLQADHINMNTMDNRRSNLKIVTGRQNCANLRRKRKTGWPCVQKNPGHTYSSIPRLNGKKINLGCFPSAESAAEALFQWGRKLFGELSPYKSPLSQQTTN